MFNRITSDPTICHGKPCFKGTRILLSTILDSIAHGDSFEDILNDYPKLSKADILEAIEYASTLLKGEEFALKKRKVV